MARLNGLPKKSKKEKNNDKNYDVMNPEAANPEAKKAAKSVGKALKKIAKAVGKTIRKIVELIAKIPIAGPIIILILIVLLVIVAFQHMPGMMQDKLLGIFKIDPSEWLMNGAVAKLDENYQDIIDVCNYLEEMEYSLVGDGFVTPVINDKSGTLKEAMISEKYEGCEFKEDDKGVGHYYDKEGNIIEDLKYYDKLGQTIDNETGKPVDTDNYKDKYGIIRSIEDTSSSSSSADPDNPSSEPSTGDSDSSTKGKVSKIEKKDISNYALLRSYLLSNYRIYTLKNSDENFLKNMYAALSTISGNRDAWAKGLIKLYNSENGIATDHWWSGIEFEPNLFNALLSVANPFAGVISSFKFNNFGDAVSINETNLSLKKGTGNNAVDFSIEGWAPRYGMNLSFLLSLHLGTNAPDLTTAMLQNFDTEIQVYLNDGGDGEVKASYVDPNLDVEINPESGATLDKMKTVLHDAGYDLSADGLKEGSGWWRDLWNRASLDKENCELILKDPSMHLVSPNDCEHRGQAYVVEAGSKDTSKFLWIDTSSNSLANYEITKDVDPELYGLMDTYPNTVVKEGSKTTKFDLEHMTLELDIDDAKDNGQDPTDDNLTVLEEKAAELGFTGPRSSPVVDGSISTVFYDLKGKQDMHWSNTGIGVKATGTAYQIKKVKNINTWTAKPEGQEQETTYQWLSYKYLIYNLGEWECEAKSYKTNPTVGIDGNQYYDYYDIEWDEPKIVNEIPEAERELEDCIFVEFIIRDKTQKELEEQNLTVNGVIDVDLSKCSNDPDATECCSVCQKYVRNIVYALASVQDSHWSSYIPYIARVVGSWFRDTYFIVPSNEAGDGQPKRTSDAAINEYAGNEIKQVVYTDYVDSTDSEGNETKTAVDKYEPVSVATNRPEFDYQNCIGEDATFVAVDENYLADSGEYWTSYVLNSDGDYQLYLLGADGRTTSITLEKFLEEGYTNSSGEVLVQPGEFKTKEEAEEEGWAFVKKANTDVLNELLQNPSASNAQSNGNDAKVLWSAYGFDTSGGSSSWMRASRSDDNVDVNDLYDIIYGEGSEGSNDEKSGIYYQTTTTNTVTQVEDAKRGQTNPLIKYLFKYRKFYIYDGSEKKGVTIEYDRQRVLYGYEYVKKLDKNKLYYKGKVLADSDSFRETGYESYITGNNFYHFIGLLGDDGFLARTYGSNWTADVAKLLNKYGRSAIRESYSMGTGVVDDFLSFITMDNVSLLNEEELASQWLDWQLDMLYMQRYGVTLQEYYQSSETDDELLKLTFDPRDPDLIDNVHITKTSLSAFSILENTGTLDAEYAYRDFKELMVELDYFDKEDLSSKNPEVFTWVLPEVIATGWPNRPWDKQNVDYGTLIQSHDTYDALGVFDGINMAAGGVAGTGNLANLDPSKIYWIGDSWNVRLNNFGVAANSVGGNSDEVKSGYWWCKVGSNAPSSSAGMNIPSDTMAIVVGYGLNGNDAYGTTQQLIDDLLSKHPNIPIFVLKTSHYGSGFSGFGSDSGIDKYNSEMQSYCSSKNNVTFIDVTKNINDSSGSGPIKSSYDSGDHLHLNESGVKQWYNDIISAIKGGSSSSTTTTTPTTSGTTSGGSTSSSGSTSSGSTTSGSTSSTTTSSPAINSSSFGVEAASGDVDKADSIITASGVEYKQFNQSGSYGTTNVYDGNNQIRTDSGDTTLSGMGCGIYSSTSLLSGYSEGVNPLTTVQWLHDNIGTSAFNNDGSRTTSIDKMLDSRGVSGNWTNPGSSSEIESVLKEAFSAGKPVIINVAPGNMSPWTTSGGHYICFCGIDSDGNVYTADSVSSNNRLKISKGSSFDDAIKALGSLSLGPSGIWVPDTAPTGAKATVSTTTGEVIPNIPFQGYEADQKVVSPVTGKILKVGKHDRMNVYTGEMEEVEYVTIKVMDKKNYFEERLDESKDYGYSTSTQYDTAGRALDLFYDEYSDVCAGYIVTLDGFDVDLSLCAKGADDSEPSSSSSEPAEPDPSASTGTTTGTTENPNNANKGVYEKNKVNALYNSQQMNEREEKEQAKSDAPFFINIGEGKDFPDIGYSTSEDSDIFKGYYIKEGAYIGKTIVSDEELVENPDKSDSSKDKDKDKDKDKTKDSATKDKTKDTTTDDSEKPDDEEEDKLPDKLTYTYEDFEGKPHDYMRLIVKDIDNAIVDDVETFFNIPEPTAEGGTNTTLASVSQSYQAQPGDLEILAEAMHNECGYDAYCMDRASDPEYGEFVSKCTGYSMVNKLLPENEADYGGLYNKSDTSRSPLAQVVTSSWYGIREHMEAYISGGCKNSTYSAGDLKNAEFCLKYDCTSVAVPKTAVIEDSAKAQSYKYAVKEGEPIPRYMCQQGGLGDGAPGQAGIIVVGYCDCDRSGGFGNGDEILGIDGINGDGSPHQYKKRLDADGVKLVEY